MNFYRSFYSNQCYEELINLAKIAAEHSQKLKIFKSRARVQVQKCSSLYSSEEYPAFIETAKLCALYQRQQE